MRAFALAAILAFLTTVSACDTQDRSRDEPRNGVYLRVVTLAPNLAELVFAAGAGDRLVGVSAYSDFPPQVQSLPLVGDAFTVDQEQLALLEPDLLLAWQSGTPTHVVDELRRGGYRVESIPTRSLGDIPRALLRIGELTGSVDTAGFAAQEFQQELRALGDEYADATSIRVFYQVSMRPLFTVNGEHYASELITLCGGHNVFAELGELAPSIDVEAVIDRNPEVMLAGSDAGADAFAEWSRWPEIAANRYGNHYFIPGDEIGRATTRVITAGRAICTALRSARERRDRERGDHDD